MEELLTTNNLPAPPVPGIFVNRELSQDALGIGIK